MTASLGAFLVVVIAVVVTPGPDTALTVRNTLTGGRRAGVFSALGVVTGQATWTVAAAAGISALLFASAPLLVAVKAAGAGYLVYLGVGTIWKALHDGGRVHAESRPTPCLRSVVAYRQGFLSNLGNPKIGLFVTGLLPQFMGGRTSFLGFVALGSILWATTFAWLSGYAVVIAKGGDLLRRPAVRRRLELVTGTALAALGLRLALERP